MCIYDVYGPCSCPHGRCFTVLAQCFAVGSWITSVLSVTSCFYVFVRPIPEEGEPELPREGFGYISRQVGVQEPPAYRQCAWYERSEKEDFFAGDGMWNAGKAMSLLAVGIGFVAMCITLCTCCVAFELPTFDGLFWTCLLCFIAQSLTFLSWGSDLCDEYECTWSSGTGMNITAAMMWIWAANMVKSFPEALPPRGSRRNNNNKQRHRRRPQDNDDDDDGAEDSPYLNNNNNNNTPFQDEYNDEEEDEFNDWNEDDGNGNHHNRTADHDPQGYYDENGDWHEPEEPQGYYDDDGNWYQYDNDNDKEKGEEGVLDGAAESSSYNGSYYGQEGEDPLQPSRRYNSDDDNDGYEEHGYGGGDNNNNNADDGDHSGGLYDAYDYGDAGSPSSSSLQAGMSQEEMEFMRASQRTMNSMN